MVKARPKCYVSLYNHGLLQRYATIFLQIVHGCPELAGGFGPITFGVGVTSSENVPISKINSICSHLFWRSQRTCAYLCFQFGEYLHSTVMMSASNVLVCFLSAVDGGHIAIILPGNVE